MDTSGFYRKENQDDSTIWLHYAPNFVYGPGFELVRGMHSEYGYPVHGWWWFDSRAAALEFFDLPVDWENPEL